MIWETTSDILIVLPDQMWQKENEEAYPGGYVFYLCWNNPTNAYVNQVK